MTDEDAQKLLHQYVFTSTMTLSYQQYHYFLTIEVMYYVLVLQSWIFPWNVSDSSKGLRLPPSLRFYYSSPLDVFYSKSTKCLAVL